MERAAGTAVGPRGVSAAGEDAALAGLELTRAGGGSRGFSVGDGIWPAASGAGQLLTGAAADELERKIRARWQARQ